MKLQIKYTGMQKTPAVARVIERKMAAIMRRVRSYEKQSEGIAYLEVARLPKHHKKGKVFYAEALLRFQGFAVRAEHLGSDIFGALDALKDKLEAELLRLKTKRLSLRKRR